MKIIITDQEDHFIKGLEKLSRPFYHIFDINSVLNNLKNLSSVSFDKCVELSEANSKQEYQRIYNDLKDNVEYDPK